MKIDIKNFFDTVCGDYSKYFVSEESPLRNIDSYLYYNKDEKLERIRESILDHNIFFSVYHHLREIARLSYEMLSSIIDMKNADDLLQKKALLIYPPVEGRLYVTFKYIQFLARRLSDLRKILKKEVLNDG